MPEFINVAGMAAAPPQRTGTNPGEAEPHRPRWDAPSFLLSVRQQLVDDCGHEQHDHADDEQEQRIYQLLKMKTFPLDMSQLYLNGSRDGIVPHIDKLG